MKTEIKNLIIGYQNELATLNKDLDVAEKLGYDAQCVMLNSNIRLINEIIHNLNILIS